MSTTSQNANSVHADKNRLIGLSPEGLVSLTVFYNPGLNDIYRELSPC
jgi:hypothetical protein